LLVSARELLRQLVPPEAFYIESFNVFARQSLDGGVISPFDQTAQVLFYVPFFHLHRREGDIPIEGFF